MINDTVQQKAEILASSTILRNEDELNLGDKHYLVNMFLAGYSLAEKKIAELEALILQREGEVEFAEWVYDWFFKVESGDHTGKWFRKGYIEPDDLYYTKEQLHALFIEHKNKEK